MKNKKAFTLVEILAVIVIMGLIIVLVLPTFKSISKKVNQQKYDKTIFAIEEAARLYANKGNNFVLKENGDSIEITIENLIQDELLKEAELINPLTKIPFDHNSKIVITKKGISSYEVETYIED